VTASADPDTVDSGGSSNLSAIYSDSQGHGIASWAWDDGGAGGSFDNANAQSPVYTAPVNTGGTNLIVTLTVTATCNGSSPLSDSDSILLAVRPLAHTLSVTASADPGIVASGGSTSLTASAVDSHGHGMVSWSWGDGGAGGTFLPSASIQNPTYTARANTGDTDITVTLTVTATCNGSSPLSDSDSTSLTVHPVEHILSVTASADPGTVDSGGTTDLSASCVDPRGHGIATWSWSDGGAGGSFSPSANVRNPTYTAPANGGDTDLIVTLTVTATCNGLEPVSGSGTVALTVLPSGHSLTLTATATPDTVLSNGITQLSVTYTDSFHHGIAAWQWSDGGQGGAFLPSAQTRNPSYNAASNFTEENKVVVLTVTATCNGPHPITRSAEVSLTVLPIPSESTILGSSVPGALVWGGVGAASVLIENTGTNTWGVWDGYHLGPENGIDRWSVPDMPLTDEVYQFFTVNFAFNVVAPPMTTLTYESPVTATSAGVTSGIPLDLQFYRHAHAVPGGLIDDQITISRFADIQPGTNGGWARFWTEECAGRTPPIVVGYPDGTYRPLLPVDRASMAVYMARALKLTPEGYQGYFLDVGPGHWAWQEIEACYRADIVRGYGNNTYRPALTVNRDAMAVYVARGMSGGLEVPPGPPEPTFPDVATDHWAYDEVEFAVANGVVRGYDDGLYHPTWAVTRDQMSVYVYRGFVQPVGSPVVLGGPAVCAANPAEDDQYGWASRSFGPTAGPGYAYVMFDALRLGADLAYGGTWDVRFELRRATAPDVPASGAYTTVVSFTPEDIAAAKSAARATGDPYVTAVWTIPPVLAPGGYYLVVSVEDETGTFSEIARRPYFVVTL
jgi:hypothetical protein